MVNTYILKLDGEKRLDYEFNKPEHSKEKALLEELSKRKGWKLKKLKHCCITIHRGNGSSIYTIEGVPILKVRNLHNGYIDWDTDFVLTDWFREREDKIGVKRNDILLTSTGVGTIGRVDIFDEDKKVAVDGHITILRVKENYNPRYFLYYLRSKLAQNQIERFTTGCTGQTELNLKHIENFDILIPEDKETQDKIVGEVEKYIDKSNSSYGKFKTSINKLKGIVREVCSIKEKKFPNHFIVPPEELKDRLDCYFHHPERKYIVKELQKIDKSRADVIKGADLEIIKPITKNYFEDNETKTFKYLDIGNTEKELGDILGFEEDILLNLPSRAKKKVKKNDILQPRPIGSMEGIVIVSQDFDEQLASTGFIQIRTCNYEDGLILWATLKSDIVQKQMFYLQTGSIQPEITPNNFKKYLLIPVPSNAKETILKNIEMGIMEARKNIKSYKENKEIAEATFLEFMDLRDLI